MILSFQDCTTVGLFVIRICIAIFTLLHEYQRRVSKGVLMDSDELCKFQQEKSPSQMKCVAQRQELSAQSPCTPFAKYKRAHDVSLFSSGWPTNQLVYFMSSPVAVQIHLLVLNLPEVQYSLPNSLSPSKSKLVKLLKSGLLYAFSIETNRVSCQEHDFVSSDPCWHFEHWPKSCSSRCSNFRPSSKLKT